MSTCWAVRVAQWCNVEVVVPKGSLAKLSLEFVIGNARTAFEAGSRSEMIKSECSRRSAIGHVIRHSFRFVDESM